MNTEAFTISDTAWKIKNWLSASTKNGIAIQKRTDGYVCRQHVIVTTDSVSVARQFPGAYLVSVVYDDGSKGFSLDAPEFLEWINGVITK